MNSILMMNCFPAIPRQKRDKPALPGDKDWTHETFIRGDLIKEQETDEELQQWKEKEKPAYITYHDGSTIDS